MGGAVLGDLGGWSLLSLPSDLGHADCTLFEAWRAGRAGLIANVETRIAACG